jgi:glycine cleavage system aminomethyltransferase T
MKASSIIRRSPVHDCLEELNPEWVEIHNMKVPLRFKDATREAQLKTDLALCDLSCLPRMSVKGPDSLAWSGQAGIPIPENLYGCRPLADTGLVIRTDRQEVFLEDGPGSPRVSEFERQLSSQLSTAGVCWVRRQDASFQLTGARCNAVLRETCGVDFTQPPDGVVMTRVAGVSCMVLPFQAEATPAFRLWLDPSYGPYLWDALLEIVCDEGGDAIGSSLQEISKHIHESTDLTATIELGPCGGPCATR